MYTWFVCNFFTREVYEVLLSYSSTDEKIKEKLEQIAIARGPEYKVVVAEGCIPCGELYKYIPMIYRPKYPGQVTIFANQSVINQLTKDMISKEQALEAMERIFNYCEEIDLHIPEDERTGYNMLPDVQLVERYILSKEN